MPGFKSQVCYLLACDLGEQLRLSEPQFLLCGPMAAQPGQDSSSWTSHHSHMHVKTVPSAAWGGKCWRRECDGCSPISHA